jgi:formylglycine-generating enzyme required for sulfatase activity
MTFGILPITATRLELGNDQINRIPEAGIERRALEALQANKNLVILGTFGSGKTSLCNRIATFESPSLPPRTAVPVRVIARAPDCHTGLLMTIGKQRLTEAIEGRRILLLDGLDEIALAPGVTHKDFFNSLIAAVGPRWLFTSRPGHFRTELASGSEQINSLGLPNVETLVLNPLPTTLVRDLFSALEGGAGVIQSVADLTQASTTPILLKAAHAALPHIEPGRPIQPWGLFDAWIRHEVDDEHDPDEAMERLTQLAWQHFEATNFQIEDTGIRQEHLRMARLPASLRRSIFVTDLDGLCHFAHRSVYEFFIAAGLAPRLAQNQDQGPDELSGRAITDAVRTFTVGRISSTTSTKSGQRAYIPRGNFIAGGNRSVDERPLRITHLNSPAWLARAPVTHDEWSAYIHANRPASKPVEILPEGAPKTQLQQVANSIPVYGISPDEADNYASWQGARLPSADEWEKAVRGFDGRYWPWGDQWHQGSAVTAEFGVKGPLPARSLGAQGENQLFAAIGNLFEYTSSQRERSAPNTRVVMGGAFNRPPHDSRASLRFPHSMTGSPPIGLRLAWDAK